MEFWDLLEKWVQEKIIEVYNYIQCFTHLVTVYTNIGRTVVSVNDIPCGSVGIP